VPKTKQTEDSFEIYSTTDGSSTGLVQVSDPLHQKILAHLAEGPMSTTDISEMTGKAQSTLSVHLDQMVSQHLIHSEYDKNDSRRKIFTISSVRLAYSKDSSAVGLEASKSLLASAMKDPKTFYKCLLKAFLMETEANGLNICPMMETVGSQMAERMAQKAASNKVEDVIKQLQDFYERNDMGEVCIYTFLPLTIIIRDAEESPYMFEAMSSFSHGLFKTMLSLTIGRRYEITKSEIFGTGNNYYKFVIELAK
jgi:predicted transcriptional regulator